MIIKKNVILVIIFCTIFAFYNTHSRSASPEVIRITPQMKNKILQSPYKVNLRTNEGKKIIVFLYADNERREQVEYYSCISGKSLNSVSTIGAYYLYLYDVNLRSFLPTRIKIFSDFGDLTFNTEGADFIVLSNTKEKKSDVLLISQFGDCNGNFFEAYGFSDNNKKLKNYFFLSKKKQSQFYGRIGQSNEKNKLIVYGGFNDHSFDIKKMSLFLSSMPEMIELKPI